MKHQTIAQNIIILKELLDLLKASKKLIIDAWVTNQNVQETLQTHNITADFFKNNYAVHVLDYYIEIIEEKQTIGQCPVIIKLLEYFQEQNITSAELYTICIHFRESLVKALFQKNVMNESVYDAVSSIFDENFKGVMQTYTKTIYVAKQEAKEFHDLIEDSSNEIYIFDKNSFLFTYANKEALKNTGYTMEELITFTPDKLNLKLSEADIRNLMELLLTNEKKQIVFETIRQRKDKSTYPIRIRMQLMKFNDKERFVAFANDISEEKKANQLVKYFQKIVENSTNEIYISDKETMKFIYMNKSARENLGYSPKEILDLNPLHIDKNICEDKIEEITTFVYENRDGVYVHETQHMRKDGSLYNIELKIENMHIDENESTLIAIGTDITKKVQALQEKEHYYKTATTDHLTKIYNRHMFDTILHNDLARFQRYEGPLSIIMLDIDYFKKINDTYGHNVGDTVLIEVVHFIASHLRKSDVFARWGGEEFVILLPGTNLNSAAEKAEQLRTCIAELHLDNVGHITCSFGVTQIEKDECSVEEILARVDKALYKAKNSGRDQVQVL